MRAACAIVVLLCSLDAFAVDASGRYLSPRNPERRIRPSTELIVLHTTEAPAKSSLEKLSERGECHFCVTEDGTIYRIVDRDREAFHAGRSMWNGKEDIDKYSIGIECVGYHDKEMSLIQLYAIRDLVADLKSMYHLSDDKVVTHSQVAYGSPNKWQKKKHRGRKRCGMLFAMPSVRRILGLKSRAASDPDVRAKRLVVGDPYLEKVLYGGTDTLRATYANVRTPAQKRQDQQPKRTSPRASAGSAKTGPAAGIMSWFGKPASPAVQPSAQPAAAPASPASPKPQQQAKQRAAFRAIPASIADLKAQGYTLRGKVTAGRTASQIAGARWNRADTYYTIRNKVIPGNTINPAKIEVDMGIWMK